MARCHTCGNKLDKEYLFITGSHTCMGCKLRKKETPEDKAQIKKLRRNTVIAIIIAAVVSIVLLYLMKQ